MADRGPASLAEDENLWQVVERVCAKHGERIAIHHRNGDDCEAVTYRRLTELVAGFAVRLRRHGVRRGERVVVMGDTSLCWAVADFAALSIGAVVVPIYPTSSAEQVKHIVGTTGPVVAVADNDERERLLCDAGITRVLTGLAPAETAPTETTVGRDDPVTAGDVATVVFTSGTTGEPKGCVLTHRNVYCGTANVAKALHEIFAPPDGSVPRTVIALPLSHMYGRSTLLAILLAGGEAVLIQHPAELFDAMHQVPPTFLALTPYLLEKLDRAARAKETADAAAATTALGQLEFIICGGASLSPDHHDSFRRRGITILGAYGMTESAAAAAINRPSGNRIGTVGRPNPGTSITVDDSGELILRGDNVSPGYWGEIDPVRTGSGPFSVRTGDLGIVDGGGFVRITGRRKDILVTSSGKNVAPAPLEDRIRAHPLVSQCIVIGDQRPYVTALIAVDSAEVGRRRLSEAEVENAIRGAVDAANTLVSRAESIRRFRVARTEFSISSGHLTTSGKLVRAKILADYANEIDTIYS